MDGSVVHENATLFIVACGCALLLESAFNTKMNTV